MCSLMDTMFHRFIVAHYFLLLRAFENFRKAPYGMVELLSRTLLPGGFRVGAADATSEEFG